MLAVTLPLPPSANALFRNLKSGGRAKTAEYKAWTETARYAVITAWRAANKPSVAAKDTPMMLTIDAGITDRSRDLGNVEKAISDVLAKELPIPDDRYFDLIVLRRGQAPEGMAVVKIATLHPT